MGLADRALRRATREGLRRGVGDGSRAWLVVGAAAVGVRLVRRMTSRKTTVVTERLEPGQTLVIHHLAPGE